MSCERFRKRLGEFLAGALADDESAETLRHLETCEACGAELAELERIEGALRGLRGAPLGPPVVRRPFARRGALAAAAALVLAGVLTVALVRPGTPRLIGGRARLVAAPATEIVAGASLPWGTDFAALELARVAVGGRVAITAWPQARLAVPDRRHVHLASGDGLFEVKERGGPFAVLTPLGTVRVEGTRFLVRVKEDGTMANGTVVKAAAGGVVMVAVLAGAVTWIAKDGSTKRIEAGQQAVARAAALEIETLAKVEAIAKEKEALAAEKQELEAAKRSLEEKVAALSAELDTLKAEAAAQAPAAPGKRALAFGKYGELEDLETIAWKDAGAAAEKMSQVTKEILDKGIESLEELQKDPKAMELGAENLRLIPLAVKLMGKVPTHAPVSPANGAFTHPIVQWNLLAARLEHAGLPLNERQIGKMNAIGGEFDDEWERLQGTYTGDTILVEKIVDELEIKKEYMDRIEALLTRKQRDAVIDPAVHHLYPWDVHSPAVMVAASVGAFGVEKKEGLREAAAERFRAHLDLKEGTLEASSSALGEWAGDVESILSPVP
jgi:ferric-dicitrate binding protein FerR (iron transport regulator)